MLYADLKLSTVHKSVNNKQLKEFEVNLNTFSTFFLVSLAEIYISFGVNKSSFSNFNEIKKNAALKFKSKDFMPKLINVTYFRQFNFATEIN